MRSSAQQAVSVQNIQMMVKRLCTNNKIEKMVEVLHCKVGDARHRHGQVEVLPYSSHQDRRQASETSRQKRIDTHSGCEFRQDDAFRKRRYCEGTSQCN